jgi:hypothetical protein
VINIFSALWWLQKVTGRPALIERDDLFHAADASFSRFACAM